SLNYGAFGKIKIYHPKQTPTSIALFVSGDGGWEHGVINMAKNIALQGALVLGIDAKYYRNSLEKLSSKCYYPAADFENLSIMIQKKYKFPIYKKPILIGYSYGATLVYGILSQAPANTFKGAIALGFSPDIEINKPLCKGNGLSLYVLKKGKSFYLDQTKNLSDPFIALNGLKDKECDYNKTNTFLKGVKNAQLIALTNVGHGFSIADHWLPQFNIAYKKILSSLPYYEKRKALGSNAEELIKFRENLPTTLINSSINQNLPFIFMISGDGGWTSFDHSLAESFAKKGYAVVGLDAQSYFWNAKTPDITSTEIEECINYYRLKLHKDKFILAGFSFGASLIPFIASRLNSEMKSKLINIFALSPDEFADFEIHLSDMLDINEGKEKYNVLNEFKKIKSVKPVCFFGEDENLALKEKFVKTGIKVYNLPGGHHYDSDFISLSNQILKDIK
ncbi:MAG: virulence factor, partial [Oligoflexus sp.]|nr:virulence factor [Pseudopedobacter sp.]